MRSGALSAIFVSALALLIPTACGSDGSEADATAGGDGGTPTSEAGTTDPETGTTTAPDAAGTDGAVVTPPSCAGKTGAAGDKTIMMTSGGKPRSFDLHVPATYDPAKGAPLVFVFHGYTMTAAGMASASHFAATADTRGMIVAFPTGLGTSFNAGDCCGTAVTDNVDDVAFTRDMIANVDAAYCVDPKRVYAAGFSNGGFLSYRLACDLADKIAAVAPVSGGLRLDVGACNPARPIALLHIHGTSDVVVPFAGGGLGAAKPVTESVGAFRTKNKCAAGDGTNVFALGDVSCTRWDGCTAGADVELCTVTGGGHQWPGGELLPYGPALSNDLSASEAIADFFEAHPMP